VLPKDREKQNNTPTTNSTVAIIIALICFVESLLLFFDICRTSLKI
jgi:hypothetical protein